ncbi:N-acetylneuraminate synthase [Methanoregula formicica]|uniref:N-acetylneuraminate synthase n=1 Tax=Methanoregula formicica (strain DSM 22288 / NBRC 105244 / SMSP) TaxID=593750 RepID=L0HGZ8_METFS|nr:N-acetylneuraminate synthase [Methanoregula formicica]AGB02349.1 N-acetylneuraminate synthase [Methanoregula formicica SMSP]
MITLGNKKIGDGEPCFIIAEAGINHNGDIALAKSLIDAAFSAKADAVKFQTFNTDSLVTADAQKAEYQKESGSSTETQYAMLKKLELTKNDFKILSEYAKKKGIIFLSTGFDDESIEILIHLKIPAFKIPSGEITNLPLLKKIAQTHKPVILSTGMATLEEIRDAVDFLKKNGCRDIILLHCTSSYPAPFNSVNLRVIGSLRKEFNVPVGYSDHTKGTKIPVAAVALGACVVEKHMTVDRSLPGPDHKASIEPHEFRRMVESIRNVEMALGSENKAVQECEQSNRNLVRKSIVAKKIIRKGSVFSEEMFTLKRPGTGIEPRYITQLIGKSAKCDIRKDSVITWDMVE